MGLRADFNFIATALLLLGEFALGQNALWSVGEAVSPVPGVVSAVRVGVEYGPTYVSCLKRVSKKRLEGFHATGLCDVDENGVAQNKSSFCQPEALTSEVEGCANEAASAVAAQKESNNKESASWVVEEDSSPEKSGQASGKKAQAAAGPPSEQNKSSNESQRNSSQQTSTSADGSLNQAELQSDITSCRNSVSQSYECCHDPVACGTNQNSAVPVPSDAQGIRAYCAYMKSAGMYGANENANAAGICFSHRDDCSRQCDGFKSKWTNALNSCSSVRGCNPDNVRQAISIFEDASRNCDALASIERSLARQSASNLSASYRADLCEESTTASAGDSGLSGSGFAPVGSLLDQSTAHSESPVRYVDQCSLYPNSPQCGSGARESLAITPEKFQNGNDSFIEDESNVDHSNFNVETDRETSQQPAFASVEPEPASGHQVKNGGGDSIDSGPSLSGGVGVALGAEATNLASAKSTDVLNGFRGGGSGTSATENSEMNLGGSGFENYGGRGVKTQGFKKLSGFDLKDFLPGGKRDPKGRNTAGVSLQLRYPDIGPKEVNIFERVSNRFRIKCQLQLFLSCENMP